MNRTTKLALVILAVAAFSGCASTRNADLARADAATAPAADKQVSKAAGYGSRGGYRYRRLIAVNASSAS